ncbi:hypothetical protein C6H88_00515 [Chlamydia muridarum str. Nigg]|jgi:hypothetical protein|uniref:Uncharacterized protein n=2 Tax=Chlamydia muridarum TaxID=83560 RepID=A0A069ZWB0_CHLMR|nr:hypothetical protein [Chlamydia muridarum]AAF38977.1 conserved hypothetical protein [Chlamydia muridarum str. Nigg]AHH22496.1 hypothetical protein TAC_00520 [Chlamydia muridarum str. Nigg3 CMUT3-5]AHH23420.1 hypothetical protein Y015_00520 [Chlamydia muridarum str. Nigg CM972]AID37647.1 hypothetical protein BB17_00535 [Chlamydia muridarum str. Nigg 2 MCR]AIT90334.1 hypothetical protein NC80_00500 [Chlamydia muridarum]
MLFWGVCSLFLGGLFGGYCRLRYTAKVLLLSWKQLLDLSLRKRRVLHEMVKIYSLPFPKLEEEIAFLIQGSKYSLKEFLNAYYEDSFTFYEMERFFTLRLKRTLESLKTLPHTEAISSLMEELLACENAFSFEVRAFEKAAETYVSLHNHLVVGLAGKLFRFPKVPLLSLAEMI